MFSPATMLRGSPARCARSWSAWAAHTSLITAISASGLTGGHAQPAPDRSGRLDLRLKSPHSAVGIEGDWIYKPLDGSAAYRITIRSTKGGFYEFEGVKEGSGPPVVELDRAEEGTLYRGQVIEGFDPCIPSGARFSLLPTADALVFEPAMPMSAPNLPAPRGACAAVTRYHLAAKGHGDRVRLRSIEDLSGGGRIESSQGQSNARVGSLGQPGLPDRPPAAAVTIGGPTAPDDAQVLVLGSIRDATQKLWHRVQLVGSAEEPDESKGGEGRSTALDEAHGGKQGRDAVPGERGKAGAERRDPTPEGWAAGGTREPTDRAGGPGSADGTGDNRPAAGRRPPGPVSGYVPSESLVVKWECRFDRSAPGTKP